MLGSIIVFITLVSTAGINTLPQILCCFWLQLTFFPRQATGLGKYKPQGTLVGYLWFTAIIILCTVKVRLHTAINRADFISWWMWFNRLAMKELRHFLTKCILLPLYVYTCNMHQDTKSARLIAMCKCSLRCKIKCIIIWMWVFY